MTSSKQYTGQVKPSRYLNGLVLGVPPCGENPQRRLKFTMFNQFCTVNCLACFKGQTAALRGKTWNCPERALLNKPFRQAAAGYRMYTLSAAVARPQLPGGFSVEGGRRFHSVGRAAALQ